MKLFKSLVLGAVALAMAGVVAPSPASAGGKVTVYVGGHGYHGHGLYRRHGNIYLRGYRGYRHQRHGYRLYSGFWFPGHLFAPQIIVAPPRHRVVRRYYVPQGLSQAHYRWCDARYISYRYHDNTFQPYHGPRKQCVSPYYY